MEVAENDLEMDAIRKISSFFKGTLLVLSFKPND